MNTTSSPSLAPLAALLLLSPLATAGSESVHDACTYRVKQTTRLNQVPDGTGKVAWWISIPGDAEAQKVLDFEVLSAPGPWRVVTETERGNRFLYVEAMNPTEEELEAVVAFTLRRDAVAVDVDPAEAGPLTEMHRQFFAEETRQDAPNMEVTPRIQAIADNVCGDETNVARQARALLDHVADFADHYSKDPTKPSCGIGNNEDCLTNEGGCCTDLHSLFISLARARGIPARLQMGYRLLHKNAGRDVDPGYRCWAEYFVPGYGWVPADIVEADAAGAKGRAGWFTGLTTERLWLNQGRDFLLGTNGRVNHMSLGHAEIDGVSARILPEGELAPQLSRRIEFELLPANRPAKLARN